MTTQNVDRIRRVEELKQKLGFAVENGKQDSYVVARSLIDLSEVILELLYEREDL